VAPQWGRNRMEAFAAVTLDLSVGVEVCCARTNWAGGRRVRSDGRGCCSRAGLCSLNRNSIELTIRGGLGQERLAWSWGSRGSPRN